jgi:DNA-binding response OmpR family regulator
MASASLVKLCRLLLRRSDRHPIGIVDGSDLAEFEPRLLRAFVNVRLLVEREILVEGDGFVFLRDGENIVAANIDGDGVTSMASAAASRQYDIGFEAICSQIRAGANLRGQPVAVVAPNTYWLGSRGTGSRRVDYYVARVIRPHNSLDRAFALKIRSNGNPVVILTPTDRELPGNVIRQAAAESIAIASIEDALIADADEPFRIELPSAVSKSRPISARLSVDTTGKSAKFDGNVLKLPRREFEVLVLLSSERVAEDGNVTRDRIAAALSSAIPGGERYDEQIEKVVSNLRRILRAAGAIDSSDRRFPIQSQRGMGYRLMLPAEEIEVF